MNLTHVHDDEPALLWSVCAQERGNMVLLNEENIVAQLCLSKDTRIASNLWYLDNSASNNMTGEKSKYNNLDENIKGEVRFGDGPTVHIGGKESIIF